MVPISFGNNTIYENKKLHNTLLIVGGGLIITGIVLAIIGGHLAGMVSSLCITLGAPILLFGIMLTIVRKSQPKPENHGGNRSHHQPIPTTRRQQTAQPTTPTEQAEAERRAQADSDRRATAAELRRAKEIARATSS